MEISPQQVRQTAEIALVLEPILDKADCTTRYQDLEGKPLTDFLIAAINVGSVIEDFADSVINKNNKRMLSHFAAALRASNDYKNKKYINTGLLHFLFITIYVRLNSVSLEEALKNYIPIMQAGTKQDIADLEAGFEVGWSTSKSKQDWYKTVIKIGGEANNYYERQQMLNAQLTKDSPPSSYPVTKEAMDGFPIVSKYIHGIDEEKGIITSFEETYNDLHKKDPELKVGILADLAASALFLYLSYQISETYRIF